MDPAGGLSMDRDPLPDDDHDAQQSDSLNDSTAAIPDPAPAEQLAPRLAEFERIYREQFGAVVSYFARRTLEPQLVADLVADTFVAALRSFDGYEASYGSARAWLVALARRVHSLHRESDPRDDGRAGEASLAQMLDADEQTELMWWIDLERSSRDLVRSLARMSVMDREAIELVDLCGLTAAEAARELGISRGALRVRVLRTRARLRREAGDHA
jgi:RNA polymerase sigma factor (sigma-70 family)